MSGQTLKMCFIKSGGCGLVFMVQRQIDDVQPLWLLLNRGYFVKILMQFPVFVEFYFFYFGVSKSH